MQEKNKDQQVTDKKGQDKNNQQKTNPPLKKHFPRVDDEDEVYDPRKEHEDNDHPHDFKTPRADKTQSSNQGSNQHKIQEPGRKRL